MNVRSKKYRQHINFRAWLLEISVLALESQMLQFYPRLWWLSPSGSVPSIHIGNHNCKIRTKSVFASKVMISVKWGNVSRVPGTECPLIKVSISLSLHYQMRTWDNKFMQIYTEDTFENSIYYPGPPGQTLPRLNTGQVHAAPSSQTVPLQLCLVAGTPPLIQSKNTEKGTHAFPCSHQKMEIMITASEDIYRKGYM